MALSKVFRDYALQQPEFVAMSRLDQRKLLCRNGPLFVQYLLGRYFSANTGKEQVTWLLAGAEPQTFMDVPPWMEFKFVSFEAFTDALGFFNEDDYMTKSAYKEYALT